ncbi:MAG: hypothetical protein JRD02_12950 [Deltaproteobacteria bacterium]|nr:hypothetical protein [Deltaproteobacteria bacterium]
MAIWIAFASLLLAIIALTVSVRQHKSQKELSLSVEKNRVYQAVVSGRLLAIQLTGLGDAITDLEDQVGVDATTDQILTEWKDILAEAELPDFFPPPPAFWEVMDKIFHKLEVSLDDPKQEHSPASYHELFGSVEALVKVMQLTSDRMIAKRDRLRRKAKENTGEPTSGG